MKPIAGRVVVAADHGGYALKEAIKRHLVSRGVDVLDVGTSSTEAVDYPVFARAAAEAVASGQVGRGIVVDGAGIGSAMVANKVAGVRAGMAFDLATAKNAREHNDANVLTLGAGYLAEDLALQIVDVFLSTECTAERHRRRVAMIDAIDASRRNAPEGSLHPATSRSSPPMTSPDFDSLVGRITQILAANPSLLVPPTCAGCAGCAAAGATECPAGGHCVTRCPDTVRSMIACVGPGCRVSAAPGVGEVPKDLAKFIDHTLLRADATYTDIDKLCDEAAQFGFASVCVNPVFVRRCAARLAGSSSVVCTVVGFPLGAIPREMKALEARRAVREGASEIDMVIAIGALKSGDLVARRRGHSRRGGSRPRRRRDPQGDPGDIAPDGRGEGSGLRRRPKGARGVREDLDGVLHRRRHGARRRAHGAGRRPEARREGVGRNPFRRGRAEAHRRGSDTDRSLGRREDRQGGARPRHRLRRDKRRLLMADLRSFVTLDAMQPQVAAYIGTIARGFLPVAFEASLIVEISPGIEINRVTDVAVKATDVRPGMQVVERLYGMLEVHSPSQAEVRQAGAAILAALSLNEADRIKPRVLSSQVIRRVDDSSGAAHQP